MKVTRRQLRQLINESIYGSGYYPKRIRNPVLTLSPEARIKIEKLTDHEDKAFQQTGYTLGTTLQQDELVFPQDGEPYEELPYKGEDYLGDLEAEKLKGATGKIERLLPGFLSLPKDVIDAVVAFVFLSENPALHIQLEEDMVERALGEDVYHRGTHFQEMQKPENAKIVALLDDMRNNPKSYDVKFYYIYAVTCLGVNPFSKLDPYLDPNSQYVSHRAGDPQSGFFEVFHEEYEKVTPSHKFDSYGAEQAFIKIMRELRPDHEEEVIN